MELGLDWKVPSYLVGVNVVNLYVVFKTLVPPGAKGDEELQEVAGGWWSESRSIGSGSKQGVRKLGWQEVRW